MKIKVKEMDYEKVMSLSVPHRKKPAKQSFLFRLLLKIVSFPDLLATHFKYREIGMDKLKGGEPCLILMNHSCFLDLKFASSYLFPHRFSIVCTSDGFVGKEWLMRRLGCIPARKFVTDFPLVKDMIYSVKENKSSILMFPEASYSFDGTATPLPDSIGRLIKMLGIPVVMIKTHGAFGRDPLYNGLRLRKVKVSADVECIISKEDLEEKDADELSEIVNGCFDFDNFRWQQENKVEIKEDFRAVGLERVLYKCPCCLAEGKTKGEGTHLRCEECGSEWELDTFGYLRRTKGESELDFDHVPDWYAWQRECVRRELESGEYLLDVPVDICMMVDNKAIYRVGEGRLVHNDAGFFLKGCGGALEYSQKPLSSYSLYADYFWYELGDVICIGTRGPLYYCFPKVGNVVAKTRLATEELYKIKKSERQNTNV